MHDLSILAKRDADAVKRAFLPVTELADPADLKCDFVLTRTGDRFAPYRLDAVSPEGNELLAWLYSEPHPSVSLSGNALNIILREIASRGLILA
jgi:hypothetical protein